MWRLSDDIDEDAIEPGGPITADKLRTIANWLDTYDKLAITFFDLLGDLTIKGHIPEMELKALEDAREVAEGKSIQNDLRRWADELELGR